MPSPFPGMDPYLEEPGLWPDVHHELISELRAVLNVQLPTKSKAPVDEKATGKSARKSWARPRIGSRWTCCAQASRRFLGNDYHFAITQFMSPGPNAGPTSRCGRSSCRRRCP